MSFPFPALLAALLFATGCGGAGLGISDGGPVGTGIAASVVGNVVAVEDADGTFGATDELASTAADDGLARFSSVDGIDVSIVEFPDVTTTTDSDGNFSLDGQFDGALTLRYRTPELEVDQPVEVPSGGIVVLSDIELTLDGATADAGQQLGLVGRVREIDCDSGHLEIEDRGMNRYDVSIVDETQFVRGDAMASCTDTREGDDISIEGLNDTIAGRRVTALLIELDPNDSAPRPVERKVVFLGNIVALDCANNGLAVFNGDNLIRVGLPANVRLETMQGRQVSCEDLMLTLRVTGEGTLDLRRPGLVRADRLTIGTRLSPGAELPIRGRIATANCDLDVLQVANEGTVVAVRLLPDTEVRGRSDFECEDALRNELSVRGRGVVSDELPGGIDAVELEIKKVKRR